jgi:hypothetical protein
MLGTILLVILVLLLVGAVPSWPYSRDWGYYPSGGGSPSCCSSCCSCF